MAQTITIAGATYNGVPAARLGTPTAGVKAWFYDAQACVDADGDTSIVAATLGWELDGNGDLVPLDAGAFAYNALLELDADDNLQPIASS